MKWIQCAGWLTLIQGLQVPCSVALKLEVRIQAHSMEVGDGFADSIEHRQPPNFVVLTIVVSMFFSIILYYLI